MTLDEKESAKSMSSAEAQRLLHQTAEFFKTYIKSGKLVILKSNLESH